MKAIFKKQFPQGLFQTFHEKPMPENYLSVKQIHSNKIVEYLGTPLGSYEADGIIIDPFLFPQASLAIKTADCLPVLIIGKKIAMIHAGRKGLETKILQHELIKALKPSTALIGPSIYTYEVGEEIKENFSGPDHFYSQNEKLYLNLQKEAIYQLKEHSPQITIYDSGICTLKNTEYNSYRRNQTTKRNWNIFQLGRN